MPSNPRSLGSRRCACGRSGVLILASLVALSAQVAVPPAAAQESPGATAPAYARSSRGTRLLEAPGVAIKVLVEATNFGGGEVEVAELVLQPGSTGATHRHGSHELIYVLEGVLDHVVNGESHRLEPGMVGVVKLGDTVAHRVASETPVKAVLVWAPGGEADRLATMFKARPVDAAD
jgi:quercetin dioxygenase-like cupin family protein